ncbi:hypothetical protein [uncultured Brevundimonas sp.]|uniref:hypothetical protein n=1 Tax=uncultured Brevundimonas sp. TaxID=213418 RepID=UPI0030EBC301|tara:strand:+ start:11480 stop:11848 length:369 start_codon:yes stop_codon:yes gene_type:complete
MSTFQHIRLELAREPDHPRGSASTGYDLVAPLDAEGRLDPAALKAAPERSHVRRFVDDATVATGRLRHADDGRWILDLDPGDAEDVTGFRLGEEKFVLGEYVSLLTARGTQHTYAVKRLRPV